MYHLEMAKFMYLFQRNKLPNLYNQYFTSTKTVHNYNTSCISYCNFYLHAINSNAAKIVLQFIGAQIWNSLQPNWKDLSFPKFKKAVKADLILKSGCRTVSNNGSGSGLAPAQNILAVQVWFGFT